MSNDHKEGFCLKGCSVDEISNFPQIREDWHELWPNKKVSVTSRLHQCPDCALVVHTYRDAPDRLGHGSRQWHLLKKGKHCTKNGVEKGEGNECM